MTNHFFDTTADRDAFYASNPDELVPGAWCSVQHDPPYVGYNVFCWTTLGGTNPFGWMRAPGVGFGKPPS